jgi:hypothetical protein
VITIRTPALKRCPFRGEADAGELAITFPGDAPELHALGDQVEALCGKPVTHEDFTRAVLALLPEGAQVATRWQTGRWSAEVSEGDALLREPVHPEGA